MHNREVYRQVAQIHIASINQGFLATLGESFLALMYQAIDECENAVLLVEENQGRVLGFVSGGSGMGPIYKQMLRHFPRLAWSLSPALLSPSKIRRIFEILRHSKDKNVFASLPPYELFSISVLPESRRKGVAQRLYSRLVQHFTDIDAPGFRIIVGKALLPAHEFYIRMGADPKLEITMHGQEMSTVYVHDLARGHASS